MSVTVEKCLEAWTNSLRQINAKADIVFFGDSLTYYGSFAKVFPNKIVCNLGLRGDTIKGLTGRVGQIAVLNPSRVYLMAGINDVATSSVQSFADSYDRLVQSILKTIPKAEVFIQSMLPVNNQYFRIGCNNYQVKACNDAVEIIASHYNLKYIDLYSVYAENDCLPDSETKDGLHLTIEAYSKWESQLL